MERSRGSGGAWGDRGCLPDDLQDAVRKLLRCPTSASASQTKRDYVGMNRAVIPLTGCQQMLTTESQSQ